MKRFVWSIGILAAVVFVGPTVLGAQGVTTGAIAGLVTDSSGVPLEGARVVAVHGPSGTAYSAVTRADGRFTIPGMRVGGPYTVSVTVVGHRRAVQDQIQLTLGGTADLRFVLGRAGVEFEPLTAPPTSNHGVRAQRARAPAAISTPPIDPPPATRPRVA